MATTEKKPTAADAINEAREYFRQLQSGEAYLDPKEMVARIDERLKHAGKGYDALDPNGKTSAQRMEQAVKNEAGKLYIIKAQNLFNRLKEGDIASYGPAEWVVNAIQKYLGETSGTYADLDPSGQKTEGEMVAEMKAAADKIHVEKARTLYQRLGSSDSISAYGGAGDSAANAMAEDIRDELSKAGAPITALDPTGQSSAEAIQKNFTERVAAQQQKVVEAIRGGYPSR